MATFHLALALAPLLVPQCGLRAAAVRAPVPADAAAAHEHYTRSQSSKAKPSEAMKRPTGQKPIRKHLGSAAKDIMTIGPWQPLDADSKGRPWLAGVGPLNLEYKAFLPLTAPWRQPGLYFGYGGGVKGAEAWWPCWFHKNDGATLLGRVIRNCAGKGCERADEFFSEATAQLQAKNLHKILWCRLSPLRTANGAELLWEFAARKDAPAELSVRLVLASGAPKVTAEPAPAAPPSLPRGIRGGAGEKEGLRAPSPGGADHREYPGVVAVSDELGPQNVAQDVADIHSDDFDLGEVVQGLGFKFEELSGAGGGHRRSQPEDHIGINPRNFGGLGTGSLPGVDLHGFPSWDTADDYDIMHRYGLGHTPKSKGATRPDEPPRAKAKLTAP